MAVVQLGISGSEVTLPTCIALSLPVEAGKRMQSATMSDGNTRYAFYARQRRWQLSWTNLTAAELATLDALRGYNQTLRYQNAYESETWYTVVITAFSYDSVCPGATTEYYAAQMTLEQAI